VVRWNEHKAEPVLSLHLFKPEDRDHVFFWNGSWHSPRLHAVIPKKTEPFTAIAVRTSHATVRGFTPVPPSYWRGCRCPSVRWTLSAQFCDATRGFVCTPPGRHLDSLCRPQAYTRTCSVESLTMNLMFDTNVQYRQAFSARNMCYFCRRASECAKLKYIFPDIMFGLLCCARVHPKYLEALKLRMLQVYILL
jgi:hypothetical protein